VVTKRKIIAYSMLTIGVIGALFFNNNINIIPYTICYKILSILLALAGLIIRLTTPPDSKTREQEQLQLLIDNLKTNGATLKVDLSKCTIIEHSFSETQDSLLPGDNDIATNDTTLSIVVYETEIAGLKQRFHSQVINKDKATLMFLFEAHKRTIIYYDKTNPSRCYFVLDFLYR
jgi:hypothetical protein